MLLVSGHGVYSPPSPQLLSQTELYVICLDYQEVTVLP